MFVVFNRQLHDKPGTLRGKRKTASASKEVNALEGAQI
jgi:hypothetical protein